MLATLEGRPGAGRRQHGRAEARGVDAAHGLDAGRPLRRSRSSAGRPERRPGASASGPAPRSCRIREVRRISFTGSPDTARLIGAAAAANLTPCSFELGGKSPLIVCADADLDLALSTRQSGSTTTPGQVCLAGSRLLVQRVGLRPLLSSGSSTPSGDCASAIPATPRPQVGPLITPQHLRRVDGFVDARRCRRRPPPVRRTCLAGSWRPLLRADAVFADVPARRGDPAARGLRTGPHHPAVRDRRRGRRPGQRYRLRRSPRRSSPATGARRPSRGRARRRHGVGQLLLRPRSRGAVRRRTPVGHRTRGRPVELRLLLRRQERRASQGHVRRDLVRAAASVREHA